MSKLKISIVFYMVFLTAVGCMSTKNISKVESSPAKFVMPQLKSTLNLHYKLDKNSLQDTFNNVIDQYLTTDMELSAMGMDVTIKKVQPAEIELLGRRVLSRLPIEIGLSKSTFISDISAEGVLDLNFLTTLDMDTTWTLLTKTSLEHYEWLKEPSVSLGGFSLPIGKLANSIIEKSRAELETQIDRSINEQLSIREKVLDLNKFVEKPIEIDTLMHSWLHLVPEKVYMSEIRNEENWSTGNITVHSLTKITEEEPTDVVPGLTLPEFSWEQELDDTSHINLVMNIGYEKINDYLNSNFRGQTFSSDGKSITINSINLSNSKDKLVAKANVSGTINGELILSGKPTFDNDKQAFFTEDIDIDVKTKNVIHKAGSWLFKRKIKNQLKEMLYFSVADNLIAVQEKLDSEIYRYNVKDQLSLKADIKKININKFVLGNDKIHAFVTLNAYLEATIHNMRIFNNAGLNTGLKG